MVLAVLALLEVVAVLAILAVKTPLNIGEKLILSELEGNYGANFIEFGHIGAITHI
jgi:hypothetical protein